MDQRTKLDAIAVLRDYERAYFAANGWEAEIRLNADGKYVVDGTRKHGGKSWQPHCAGYTLESLPGMANNLWNKAAGDNRHSFFELVHRLKSTRIADVIANEFQTFERG